MAEVGGDSDLLTNGTFKQWIGDAGGGGSGEGTGIDAIGNINELPLDDADAPGSLIRVNKGLLKSSLSTAAVPVKLGGQINNGLINDRVLTANNTNAAVLKVGPTSLYFISGYSTAAVFIKLYDMDTVPDETDVPVLVLGIGANENIDKAFGAVGSGFLNGLARRVVTGFADGDTGAPAAGVASITFGYVP